MLVCCSDHQQVFVADAIKRTDPTGTGSIRRGFESEAVRRVRALRAMVRHAVADLDVLGMRPSSSVSSAMFRRVFSGQHKVGMPAPAHGSASDRIHAFRTWFDQAAHEMLVGVDPQQSRKTALDQAWFSRFIDQAARKGSGDALAHVKRRRPKLHDQLLLDARARGGPLHAGFGPASQDRIELLKSKTFDNLVGIDDAMSLRISRELADGMSEGLSASALARELADSIDEIGVSRARTLARTEVVGAHAEGALNSYEEAGVEGVEVEAEFTTAGDEAVCPLCEDLEGEVYTIDEARGVIPVHPNCRCAWVPVVGDVSELNAEEE